MSRPVSIVVPTWNGRAILERNLPSMRGALQAHPAGGELLVVDDGGGDDTPAWLAASHPAVRCLRRAVNGGFVAAANHGVQEARCEVVVLLNNDMRVDIGFLAPLLAGFASHPSAFAVVPRIINRTHGGDEAVTACRFRRGLLETTFPERDVRPDGPSGIGGNANATAPKQGGAALREVLFACGGAMAFERRRWLELGGLDPLYAPFYWEDLDLSWRARRRGMTILQAADSVVHHEHSATIGRRFDRRRVAAIYERNRLLFHWKNIGSARLLLPHLAWMPPRLLRAPFGRAPFLRGFAGALRRLPRALTARRREGRERRVRDDAIVAAFRDDGPASVRRPPGRPAAPAPE